MSIDPMIKKFAESLFRGYKPILPRQSQKHNTIAMYSQGKLLGKYVLGEHDPKEEREVISTIRGRNPYVIDYEY